MFKIFIAVLLGVIVGGVLLKFWREIFAVVISICIIAFSIVLSIITLPIRIIMSFGSDDKKLVREYDRIFFEAKDKKQIKACNKRIKRIETILKRRKDKEMEKSFIKMLNKAKWAI